MISKMNFLISLVVCMIAINVQPIRCETRQLCQTIENQNGELRHLLFSSNLMDHKIPTFFKVCLILNYDAGIMTTKVKVAEGYYLQETLSLGECIN